MASRSSSRSLAGLITAVSPCVLPVLPIVLGGGVGENRRRPFAIIAGLATLASSSRSSSPPGCSTGSGCRRICCATSRSRCSSDRGRARRPAGRRAGSSARWRGSRAGPSGDLGGGFLLGCALGFVFVPCGRRRARLRHGVRRVGRLRAEDVLVAVAYTLGFSVVLLAIALGGRSRQPRLARASNASGSPSARSSPPLASRSSSTSNERPGAGLVLRRSPLAHRPREGLRSSAGRTSSTDAAASPSAAGGASRLRSGARLRRDRRMAEQPAPDDAASCAARSC